jgi:hypothetical protein
VYRIETWRGIATGWKVYGNCQQLTAKRAVDLGETLKRMFPERIYRVGFTGDVINYQFGTTL